MTMKKPTMKIPRLIIVSAVAAALTGLTGAKPGLPEPVEERTTDTYQMRGFGAVSAQARAWDVDGGRVSLVRFSTESAEKARIVASKYVTDLEDYSVATESAGPHPWRGWTREIADVGLWVVGVDGAEVMVLSGPSQESLKPFAAALNADKWSVPEARAFPRYLGNFDHQALSFWHNNPCPSGEALEWASGQGAIMNIFNATTADSYAPGVHNLAGMEQLAAIGKRLDRPHRGMLYSMLAPTWWMRGVDMRNHFESPSPGTQWGRSLQAANLYQAAQSASLEVNSVMADVIFAQMDTLAGDMAMAWKVPPGEWDIKHNDPPSAAEGYRAFLRDVKGYSLEEANRLHGAAAAGWDEFPYPDQAYFFGRRGIFTDLDGDWRWRQATLEEGLADSFHLPATDDSDWLSAPHHSLRLQGIFHKISRVSPLWGRTLVDVPEKLLNSGGKIYLYVTPDSERKGRVTRLWINGAEVPCVELFPNWPMNHCSYADVTGALRPGENQVSFFSLGGSIRGRVWLTTTPPDIYPFAERTVTRRYLDWMDYLKSAKLDTVRFWLAAIRSVDRERPIKLMTGAFMQSETQDLFERYGGYLQMTGEGSSYRPMHYKGYSRLRGLPASSEGASPAETLNELSYYFGMMFWEGQDAHDYVFDLQRDIYPKEWKREWFKQHGPMVATLGKTDFPHDDRLGLLRDVAQSELYGDRGIWTWDLARGALPALGICPVLVDGPDMDKGYAAHIPLLFDTSTAIMSERRVEAIMDYVKAGGTFVAGFDTGRDSEYEKQAWPLAKALGLKVVEKQVASDVKQSPVLPLTFLEDQDLLPSLRGKTIEGMGISIDHTETSHTGAVGITAHDGVEVKPIALWNDDGTMAICEIKLGKGRIIWIGSPFYFRGKDTAGTWLNDTGRQRLLAELLTGLGVELEVERDDERLWLSRRESKNGLYDVYFAAIMAVPRGTDATEVVNASFTILSPPSAASAVFEMSAEGHPAVEPVRREDGAWRFEEFEFYPFLVRQFAMVRDDVGVAGPLHWLRTQSRTWRALELPENIASLRGEIETRAREEAKRLDQDGLSLAEGWKVRKSGDSLPEDGWTAPGFDASGWEDGALGLWHAKGWDDVRRAQYRRKVAPPESWLADDRRAFLCYRDMSRKMAATGMRESGQLWLNGDKVADKIEDPMMIDVTERLRGGGLDLAMEVEGKEWGGPGGSLYLWSLPVPAATLELDGEWRVATDFDIEEGVVQLPGTVGKERKAFGLRKTFKLPEDWTGRRIHLVVEREPGVGLQGGFMVNERGYFAETAPVMAPYGVRIDHWLQPGTNEIDIYAQRHQELHEKGIITDPISSVRLEVYD
jgi:hypothetical protein